MEENNKVIIKNIKKNIIISIFYTAYFVILSLCRIFLEERIFWNISKCLGLGILICSILIYELAYKKDDEKLAINGIETMFLAFYSLIFGYLINRFSFQISRMIKFSVIWGIIYIILKTMFFYTKKRKEYLASLSDIHEIVSKDPIKKEAVKRKNVENTRL